MTEKNNKIKIAFFVAFIHCVIGNIIGISLIDCTVLEILFLPYTFIAGLSEFAGWDWLSFILQIFSLLLMTVLFYPLVMLMVKNKS